MIRELKMEITMATIPTTSSNKTIADSWVDLDEPKAPADDRFDHATIEDFILRDAHFEKNIEGLSPLPQATPPSSPPATSSSPSSTHAHSTPAPTNNTNIAQTIARSRGIDQHTETTLAPQRLGPISQIPIPPPDQKSIQKKSKEKGDENCILQFLKMCCDCMQRCYYSKCCKTRK